MTESGTRVSTLERECVAFAKYLTGHAPSERVCASYREAHERGELGRAPASASFDRMLVKAARVPVVCRMVDVYTGVFMRRALVRKKLVLVLAILESSSPSYRQFETPDRGRQIGAIARLAARSGASFAALLLGTLVFAPLRIVYSAIAGSRVPR